MFAAKDGILKRDPSRFSPHTIIPSLIRLRTTILDVGCNAGYLGKELKKREIICDGVDKNIDALKIAKKFYRRVYVRDLYRPMLSLGQRTYDYIVFADILEHVPRPDLLLKNSLTYLASNGRIIISIPNVARIEYRIKHLLGNFDYEPGILSPDHLRFFTKKSAKRMIYESGLRIQTVIPTGAGMQLPFFNNLFAFQFIFVCHIASSPRESVKKTKTQGKVRR